MKMLTIISLGLLLAAFTYPSNHGKSIKTADGGRITLLTTKYYDNRAKDILLTKNKPNGNEEWFKIYGGRGYDLAGDFIETEDGGYAIVGSTSSYGNGNYNVYLIKVDSKGKEEWSEAYGGFSNEYGIGISEGEDGSYRLIASRQLYQEGLSDEEYDSQKWVIYTDKRGKVLKQTDYKRY